MCARRFLILILILTLMFVGGAFALYQFGDQVLVRMATPRGHYEEPARGSGPDYTKDESWLAKPGLSDDPTRWQPSLFDGRKLPTIVPSGRAATFYLHPTTYLERDRWNAPIDAGGEPSKRSRLFGQSQASVFAAVSDVWAPKYRQAAYGAFLLKSGDALQALDLAYRDVRAAFDVFLATQPKDKPIILAGHSQGSLHLLQLLAERKDALKGRLAAAYVVGWPVSVTADLPATGLSACAGPEQAGCVISWQSFKEPANTRLVTKAWVGTQGLAGAERTRESMLCVNPIGGRERILAKPSANAGTLVPDGKGDAMLYPGQVGAECKGGFLIISGDLPNLGPYALPGNNYHVYDYALFWADIRADAARRLAAWSKH